MRIQKIPPLSNRYKQKNRSFTSDKKAFKKCTEDLRFKEVFDLEIRRYNHGSKR